MSDQEKKKYRLLRPIAMGGRREKGEIVEMTPAEAEGHGPEFVEKVKDQAGKESKPSSAGEPEKTGGDENGAGGKNEEYADWSYADLQAEAKERGLPAGGSADYIRARLRENDQEAK